MTPLEFILSTVSSILGAVIMLLKVETLPILARKPFFLVMNRMFKIGIVLVYKNEDEAADEIIKDATNSKFVKILGIRGFRLASPDRKLNSLLDGSIMSYEKLDILLSDPNSTTVSVRGKDFAAKDFIHRDETYREEIIHVLTVIDSCRFKNKCISLKTHFQPESFRLIITDSSLFLSFFPKGKSASKSRCYKIAKNSELYTAYERHFDWLWNSSDNFDKAKYRA